MMLKVFSIFDSKPAFFGSPFFEQKEESAIRAFADAVNSNEPNNGFARHPEDYSLFLLGEFDNESGELIPQLPKNLITASALRSVLRSPEQLDLFPSTNGKEKSLVS